MREALKKSIALHVAVFLLLMIDLPLFWNNRMSIEQVPIIVDLNDVKISEMTNLPPKAKFGEEDKAASKVKQKEEKKYTREEAEPVNDAPAKKDAAEEATDVKEAPAEPKQNFLVAPQPRKPKVPEKKVAPKPAPKPKKQEPKKSQPKKEEKKSPELANPLKSLLASVDAMDKELNGKDSDAVIKQGTHVNNMGVEGGTGGSYFSELSISEIDAIAGRLRACWNLDPGAMGIENMIIEVRVYLNRDGTVRDAKVLDTSRYNSDKFYRSVADSARRAVYVCAPYSIFSNRYADKYDMWKTMKLRFNPFDATIK